jgi:hypothetical protein
MIMPILIVVASIIIVFIVIVAAQSAQFTVTRSAKISAPPEKIFPHVNDLHNWEAWSPWAKLDPNAKNSFEGAAFGVGAAMAWEGNCKVGVGCMTITDSKPSESIRFRLDFEKPMKATNIAEFVFKNEGGQTLVTWSMTGQKNFVGKFFHLFMNCDQMIGIQFEKGLAAIKSIAEAAN